MEGELVVIMALDFQVVVEDDPEELAFLEYDQSGIWCRVTDSKPSVNPRPIAKLNDILRHMHPV